MGIWTAVLIVVGLISFVPYAESGGAVAAQKRKAAMRSGQGPHINMHNTYTPTGPGPVVNTTHPGSLSENPANEAAEQGDDEGPIQQQPASPTSVFSSGVPQGRNLRQQRAPNPEEVKQEVTLDQLSENLLSSSQAWNLIIQPADKVTVVQQFVDQYHQQGINISKPPEIYAGMIDQMVQGDGRMLDLPFDQVLKIMAIMEYDFDNGQDKDAMAQKILGPAMYEKNRQRMMAQQQQMQQQQMQ